MKIKKVEIKDLPKGSMPLLSEETSISDGKLISKLEVSKIVCLSGIFSNKCAAIVSAKRFKSSMLANETKISGGILLFNLMY